MRLATPGLDVSLLSVELIQIVTRGMVQIGINQMTRRQPAFFFTTVINHYFDWAAELTTTESVVIPAGYTVYWRLLHSAQTGCGTHQAYQPVSTTVSSPGSKWPVLKTNNSHSTSAEVKNAWSCISSSHYTFMA